MQKCDAGQPVNIRRNNGCPSIPWCLQSAGNRNRSALSGTAVDPTGSWQTLKFAGRPLLPLFNNTIRPISLSARTASFVVPTASQERATKEGKNLPPFQHPSAVFHTLVILASKPLPRRTLPDTSVRQWRVDQYTVRRVRLLLRYIHPRSGCLNSLSPTHSTTIHLRSQHQPTVAPPRRSPLSITNTSPSSTTSKLLPTWSNGYSSRFRRTRPAYRSPLKNPKTQPIS